jgi:chemotaxis protein histidine kinase CheA
MHSTLDGKNDPHDMLEIAPDVVLVARAAAEFPSLAPDAAHRPLDRQPNMGSGSSAAQATPRVDTSFRATDTSGGRSQGTWARRAAIAFLFALCSAFAAAAWERYSDDAQATVAGLTPQIIPALMSWLPLQKPTTAAQTDPAPVTQAAASTDEAAPSLAAQPAVGATAAAAPAAAASPAPDQTEALRSMARDLANLTQQIGELQASIAQLKANQEQMARDKAKAPEPRVSEVRPAAPAEPRPTRLGAPPRSLGTLPVHRSRPPAYPPAQTAYVPPPPVAAPMQVAPPAPVAAQPDGDPVVRPPMPVR